jgi:NAD(P)-dependent dehydrogenase (short-subunit alcohol dehydrogenase family)
MSSDLRNHVAVVTGASSGIGRATALAFAHAGASVVASARNARALGTLADAAGDLPGEIVPVVADVTDVAEVDAVAATAGTRFGRIDTWVNAAAVAMYARVDETEPDELRRIHDVNVVGTLNGVRAALRVMRPARSGTIVNIGSVESRRALPLQGAYAASKHAVEGLTDALRVELAHEGLPVAVVLVMPSAINTPFFRHARSKLGVKPRPFPPVYQPETVADAIVHVAQRPVREVVVGGGGKALELFQRMSPSLVDATLAIPRIGDGEQRSGAADAGTDNLYASVDEPGESRGEWESLARRTSWYTSLIGLHPIRTRVATAMGLAVAGVLLARRR